MHRSYLALLTVIAMLGISSTDLGVWQWVPLLIAGSAIIYFGYEMGYQSGKDRALRDNRNDSNCR